MKRIFGLGAACAIVALVSNPGYAAQTATYVTANNPILSFQLTGCAELAQPPAPPVPRTCPAGNIGVGGFGFAKTAATPASVKLLDASGVGVGFVACQDLNGNRLCGEAGEPRTSLCSTGTNQPLTGFKPNVSVSVFVHSASTTCDGIGTTGTITVS